VFEDEAYDDGIERSTGERQGLRARPGIRHSAAASAGLMQLGARRIHSNCEFGSLGHGETRDLTFARPDIEDSSRIRQTLPRQRKDLFLVFGVGPIGEAVLPPAGVPLPQLFVALAARRDTRLAVARDSSQFAPLRFAHGINP
jgi:hypothetical protein